MIGIKPDTLVQIQVSLAPSVQFRAGCLLGVVGELADAGEGASFGVDLPVYTGLAEGVEHGLLVGVGVGDGGGGDSGDEGGEGCENMGESRWKEWEMHFGVWCGGGFVRLR